MNGYIVSVKFEIYPDNFDKFLDLIKINASESLKEDGCRVFDVAIKENTVFLYEVYDTEEDFKLHLNTKHFNEFNEETKEFVKDKVIENYNLVK